VHAHLEGCASCRGKADLWRSLVPALRELGPRPPAELGARRLEVEVLRQLQSAKVAPARARRRWLTAVGVLAFSGAAAAVVFWLAGTGLPPRPPAGRGYAILTGVVGKVQSGGRALAASTPLGAGGALEVAEAGEAELRLDRGSVLRLRGPARLTLGGTARDVVLGLDAGTLEAQVAHRLAGETFAVSTRAARVEVRGTHFFVGAEADRSWVRVEDGRVAVRSADGAVRLLDAGQTAAFGEQVADSAPDVALAVVPADAPAATLSCGPVVRGCQTAARAARDSMRGGDNARAVRLVTAASRSLRDADASCSRVLGGCDDELRYLRAEALRGAGRFDDAIGAYRALNRAGAPAATRQNALYAAAELERRRGRRAAALADYESALAAAPRGALQEEALVGAMECADLVGDHARAATLARRYLSELPDGRARTVARRLSATP
jgi:ferric-dicitrate binding protein FerR (iron transport regulator)